MGWTICRKPDSISAWVKASLSWESDTHRNTCLDVALLDRARGGYAAVETVNKATGARTVWAAIFAMKHYPNAADGLTFGYKDMEEAQGPNQIRCPARILDLLTEPVNANAAEWRARCRGRLARRAAARRLRAGTLIRFQTPIQMTDGTAHALFAFVRNSTFYALANVGTDTHPEFRATGRYKLRNWRERADWSYQGEVDLDRVTGAHHRV